VTFITPNADYREGTEVVSAFRITNEGWNDMIPSSNLSIQFAITYTQNGVNRSVTIPTQNQVVIPHNGDNLVFFKWVVPNGTAGISFRLTAAVDPANRIDMVHRNNLVTTVNRTIIAAVSSNTPDTQYEEKAPSDFSKVAIPTRTSNTSNSWAVWEYTNNAFVRQTYGLELNAFIPSIVPDVNSPSRTYPNGTWAMRSGYGFTLNWQVPTRALSGMTAPPASSHTAVQVASMFFPEFKYSNAPGSYRSLEQTAANAFRFPANPNAKDNTRIHFTPLWYSNGSYICQGFISDTWTPAGMLSGYYNTMNMTITGSALDDWYVA
jgi:hypothetical protein